MLLIKVTENGDRFCVSVNLRHFKITFHSCAQGQVCSGRVFQCLLWSWIHHHYSREYYQEPNLESSIDQLCIFIWTCLTLKSQVDSKAILIWFSFGHSSLCQGPLKSKEAMPPHWKMGKSQLELLLWSTVVATHTCDSWLWNYFGSSLGLLS